MKTEVAIVGAGPAGLLLAHLLARAGISSIVVETRSQEYVASRIRAGILEHSSVELLTSAGLGDRLHAEGHEHRGIYLQWPGERHHLDFVDLTGRSVWVYGQTEVQKDLVAAATAEVVYSVSDTVVHAVETDQPFLTYTDSDGNAARIDAQVIAGCDGSFGPSRHAVPAMRFERVYPYSWLGILADVAPSTDELIYALHPDGFAMHSMRSEKVSRLYPQVTPDEDIANWSDDRIWDALSTRLAVEGWTLQSGPTLEKGVTPMRSFVSAPMRWGRLLLAGDASHIVPPTGAKGLNLAIADVKRLGTALVAALQHGDHSLLDRYSDDALRRVWQATYFSWWMTSMLHVPPPDDPDRDFLLQAQITQLRYVTGSPAASAGLAENYTGSVLAYP
jgi:p-hydroxybenzoate 3-monooxygenase